MNADGKLTLNLHRGRRENGGRSRGQPEQPPWGSQEQQHLDEELQRRMSFSLMRLRSPPVMRVLLLFNSCWPDLRRCACARAVASSSGETPVHGVEFAVHSKPIIDHRSAADACATEDRIHVNGEMRTQGASESSRVGAWSVRTRSSAPNCDAQRCTSHCTSSARSTFSWG